MYPGVKRMMNKNSSTIVDALPDNNPDEPCFTFLRKPVALRKKLQSDGDGDKSKPSISFLEACKKSDTKTLKSFSKQQTIPEHVLNQRDANGLNGFSYLCQKGDLVNLKILSNIKQLDVNCEDNEGNTPLILATQAGNSAVVTFLIENFKSTLDLNKRNVFGFTCLMKAALQGRVKCLKILLAAGANPMLRDPSKGFNSLEWAKFCGRSSCITHIESHFKKESELGTRIRKISDTIKSKHFATAVTSSSLCASSAVLPNLLHPSSSSNNNRPLSIPSIEITFFNL